MPEYSSTTITPADGVKTPAMNGSTSGNYTLSALRDFILASKGQANGLASLDANGKLPSSQLPDLADDVIVVASYATLPAIGTAGKIYITADNNKMYRWDPGLTTPNYVELSVDLSAYATKAELAAEESARESEDSNLKSAIQGNTARIENLEQEHGGYVTVNYRGTNAVPTGKAKYALVESIVGKSRAWNQLCPNPMFTDDVVGWDATRGAIAYDSGRCKYTISEMGGSDNLSHRIYRNVMFVANHVYLIAFDITSPRNGNACCDAYNAGIGWTTFSYSFSANVRTQVQRIATATTTYNSLLDIGFGGYDSQYGYQVGDVIYFDNVIVRDLTQYFGGNVPAGLDLDMVRQNYPSLLIPSAYDAGSLVDTTVEGVKSVGVNIWDEEWEGGAISTTTGEDTPNSNTIRSKGYIPVRPLTNYSPYVNGMPMYHIGIFYYDYNKNFISYGNPNNTTKLFQTPSGCFYIRFACSVTYGSTYNHNIAIAQSDTALTQYYPYMTDTLTLPSVTLRSAGSVADTDELNVEVLVDGVKVNRRRKTIKVGSYTFTGNEIWSTYENCRYTTVIASLVKWSSSAYSVGNILCPTLVRNSVNELRLNGATLSGIAIGVDGAIAIGAIDYANISSLTGKTINFELATESVTLLDPIENNTILTEGGGTIETIQTQTPVIDNCMDVGYLAL